MSNYIVLRLIPPTAVDAGTFTNFLTNLTLTVYDISYAQPTAGVLIGSAAFVPPAIAPPPGPPPGGTRIAQYKDLGVLKSVATAVIEYIPPGPEYVGPDLLIELDWGGPQPIRVSQIYYDVVLWDPGPGPFPPPDTFQAIPDASVSAFVTLPPPTTLLTLPNDNTPPNFDDLLAAVTAVLAADPAFPVPVTPTHLGNLSAQQCENIANEIIYGPQAPLPAPPELLEDLYTYPTNTRTFSDTHEQDRQQFEGLLASYYSTRSATALRVTNYVFALSVAYWLQAQVQNATQALVTFPVNPNAPPSPFTTVSEAQVIFTGAPSLGLDMPPAYFYALSYDLSANSTRQLWRDKVFGTDLQSNLDRLSESIGSNLISLAPAINPAQAVRLIAALDVPATTTVPQWPVTFPAANQIFNVDWRAFPPAATWPGYQPSDEFAFWQNEAATQPLDFLRLVLWALTQGFIVAGTSLARLVRLNLLPSGPMTNVGDLSTTATPADWQAFFTANPAALPPFTSPGTVAARIAAFVQWVQKFFQLQPDVPLLNPVTTNAPPRFGVPSYDLIAQTIADYPAFALGMVINLATLETAAATAIPGDGTAQAWAVQTVETLNELFILSQIPGETAAFDFSVMESLFARGFTSREEVLDIPFDDFQQALTGTVAYDHAAAIYALAGPPPVFPPPSGGPFVPINPGCLTDCIPPLEFSPLGPVAYLHDMLRVSERSTCDHPFAHPAPGHTVLQAVIDSRRGPVETLDVTRANLETALPLIDIVNECLQLMASKSPPVPPGAVYNTAEHHLGPYKLCDDHCDPGSDHHDCACEPDDCCEHRHPACHKPDAIFAALPEYSTPASPVAANSTVVPAVWDKLKADFACCCLPYDQALDVNRTYLAYFRSCRFETMRTFRKCITEFVLDPVHQPSDFQTHLWRYPVRLDIAIEYLGISLEEYETLFNGVMPGPCDGRDIGRRPPEGRHDLPDECLRQAIAGRGVIRLPEFLKCTCLTYCEFYELWRSGFVPFSNDRDRHGFPECEPCCLDDLWVHLPSQDPEAWISKIAVFVRLWHKLRHLCGAGYTFAQLADICGVLNFGGSDFIRQLAAFQMLRDQFRLELTGREEPAAGATGADRCFLLSLWVGPAAKHWPWALHRLLDGIAKHAECRHECERRDPEFIKLLADNFDPLSKLAGFDPTIPGETWHFVPTHTLRFAEILAKIYASDFSVGEVLFLFTPDIHLDGDDPFPLQDLNEAEDLPLELPDEDHKHALWALRHKLLHAHPHGDDAHGWTWRKIEAALEHELGFPTAEVARLGEHFFPDVLEQSGQPVSQAQRRFTAHLAPTSPPMWNASPEGPFRYDAAAGVQRLWAALPIADREVIEQLSRIAPLSPAERQAVQDVYFEPRRLLSHFAMLFDNFDEAERRLIEEPSGEERWRWFQREFSQAHARCEVIAKHLSDHVAVATGQEHPDGIDAARLVLRHLFADENATTAPSWEKDDGSVPPVTWTPPANGGAVAALLGLAGTGLDGAFTAGGAEVWREIRDAMRPFGSVRDHQNVPVPTVIPAMNLALTPQQLAHVTVHNGLAMADSSGQWLGGAESFEAKWHGVLLIDKDGDYHFRAGAPTEGHEEPSLHDAHHRSWRVTLHRGQKAWVLLRHHWHDEANLDSAPLRLRRGAYELTVELVQHRPDYLDDPLHPQHTGFEVKYRGPDTEERLVALPRAHLFRSHVDAPMSVAGLGGAAAAFLRNRYGSSLRDIRRTYQRAFKALLFVHRFALSARPRFGNDSELRYMLTEATNFAGWSTHLKAGVWTTHKADFDFNFLPVGDVYWPPNNDDRAHPSRRRISALFDWWERIFDYTRMRSEVRKHCDRHLWLLFEEARDVNPADPSSLLRHMGADARHWHLDITFYQSPITPVYAVTSADLMDDRWTVRAWHADLWLRRLWCHFTVKDITEARPYLWAADDPAVPVAGVSGNANLLLFLCDGCFDNGPPYRYEDVKRLNDGLRERGREALICYLCGPGGIAKSAEELSEILLLDVRAGLCETASRIEEAISAVQTFIRRARMGLEGWHVSGAFAHLWDCRFISYRVWQACKRRELYKENWIDWLELEKTSKIEAFGFLDEQLKRATLTIAVPGGVDYWPDHLPPSHPALCLLQHRDPAEMQLLPAPREGLDLLATPERDARPSWITTVPEPAVPPSPLGVAPVPAAPALPAPKLPFWMECAIRLGTRFVRVAAAKYPPASTEFRPRHKCEHDKKPHHDGRKDKECCDMCCEECGCEHPARMDEYYFWLIDAKHFNPDSQSDYSGVFDGQQNEYYDQTLQSSTPWHTPAQLHGLLEWPAEPMVRLAWCRVHNGEFQQPRRSDWGIPYQPAGGIPDLLFLGRVADSLYISVTNPAGAGFRYDMVPDEAREFENIVLPPPPPIPGGLPAYPYFCYFEPGARLFPWSLYTPAIAVAHALRAHCRFEAALKWYELVYKPLNRDNRWALCEEHHRERRGDHAVVVKEPDCCCDTTDITCRDARHRSLLLHFLDTLMEWGDALMRRNSPEAFQQARVAFDMMRKIMGRHPRVVKNSLHPKQTVANFKPLWAAINPRLMTLYDRLDDRLSLIHACMSPRRLVEMKRRVDEQYWDDDRVRGGWRGDVSGCCDTDGSCRPCAPYRFLFGIQKAKELAAQTREFGGLLLAAFEKGDSEFLTSVRARQERELAHLNRRVREDVWRDADWQVQALGKSKLSLQASRQYYAQLIANGLNAGENGYVTMTGVSIGARTAANVSEGIGEAMDMVPDLFVGTVDFAQIPIGTKLAGMFKTIARISNTLADIATSTASLDLTEGGFDRRLQDWVHQVQVLDIQIEQTELQILGAERRRNQSLRELNVQERMIEQATETLDIFRDKFTNHAFYLFLQKQTADLYRMVYGLALNEAHEAERAFNFERGHTTHKFIGCGNWDNLHEGMLAGERLQFELARMEKAYLDHNCREYELTKHISLRLSFPMAFLRLKLTGRCDIEIPEWMFDLDYPGQYMRRIRNVSLTIPCVAGPYNEVHCRLTLLRSGTRIDPLPMVPAARCCDCCQSGNGYPVCPHDPRWVTENGALEAIATSSGQNDAGLFEVNFRDERYLPFEYRGAVSRWRVELPQENNYFEMDSLSDVVMHLNYTAREGGDVLRRAAREASECDLPGAGWCLFDLQHDFADAWELFRRQHRDEHDPHKRQFDLRFTRNMFPFVPGDRELYICKMALFYDRPRHCGCDCPSECPCCSDPSCTHQELVLRHRGAEERPFTCVSSDEWPDLYHGIVDCLSIGPLHGRREREEVRIDFPQAVDDINSAYLLCRYALKEKCCSTKSAAVEDRVLQHRNGSHARGGAAEQIDWPHRGRGNERAAEVDA
jgi:Tc toxin complex TcA C-terminal TcB-binding domain